MSNVTGTAAGGGAQQAAYTDPQKAAEARKLFGNVIQHASQEAEKFTWDAARGSAEGVKQALLAAGVDPKSAQAGYDAVIAAFSARRAIVDGNGGEAKQQLDRFSAASKQVLLGNNAFGPPERKLLRDASTALTRGVQSLGSPPAPAADKYGQPRRAQSSDNTPAAAPPPNASAAKTARARIDDLVKALETSKKDDPRYKALTESLKGVSAALELATSTKPGEAANAVGKLGGATLKATSAILNLVASGELDSGMLEAVKQIKVAGDIIGLPSNIYGVVNTFSVAALGKDLSGKPVTERDRIKALWEAPGKIESLLKSSATVAELVGKAGLAGKLAGYATSLGARATPWTVAAEISYREVEWLYNNVYVEAKQHIGQYLQSGDFNGHTGPELRAEIARQPLSGAGARNAIQYFTQDFMKLTNRGPNSPVDGRDRYLKIAAQALQLNGNYAIFARSGAAGLTDGQAELLARDLKDLAVRFLNVSEQTRVVPRSLAQLEALERKMR